MTLAQAQQILYHAAGSPIGLLLWASKPEAALQRLYQARAKLADPELVELQFRRVADFDGGNLVVTKNKVQVGGETAWPATR